MHLLQWFQLVHTIHKIFETIVELHLIQLLAKLKFTY